MSRPYCVTIPVKRHIEKFLSIRDGNPISPKDNAITWIVIRPYLVYKVKDNYSADQRSRQLSKYDGKIQFQFTTSKVKSYGVTASANSVILINRYFDHYFGRELYHHVKEVEKNAGRYKGFKAAIEDFAEKHNIVLEEDITMEALLKLYNRHRQYEKEIGAKFVARA
jgi:hypothetical protein